MHIGILPHGQSRLLFSSKQVEYARYWVHAMGYSKNLLPMPSGESLITRETLRHVSEMHCKTAEEIKIAVKVCFALLSPTWEMVVLMRELDASFRV